MNLDPYSPEQAVQGLQWGWGLVKSGNTVTTAYDFSGTTSTTDGASNTTTIVGTQGDAFSGVDINSLYNNYAARYCYNKNKRDPQTHRVNKCHWFHPTIRELEHMLDRYYGNYEVFQNQWYWSSNPGSWGQQNGSTSSDKLTWTGEHQDYARATKANYQGTNPDGSEKFDHATSEANKPYAKLPNGDWDTPYDPDWWNQNSSGGWWSDPYPAYGDIQEDGTIGGYAKRNQVFRIRAAYIPDSQIDRGEPSVDNSNYY